MPRGTTQVVTRGHLMIGTRWRLDESERDTWHWLVSVRGVRVLVRGQACIDPCQSLAIMRRLVECKKTIIPPDLAI
ncbi:hypothetical protein Tco_1433795 [Tanacetum coccineum]